MAERLAAFGRTLLFLIFVPATVALLIPLLILQRSPSGDALVPLLGPLLVLAGVALWLWVGFGFSFIGRGTPSPLDAPSELVVWGPYRWVRNPMYLGLVIGSSSLVLVAYAGALFIGFHLFVLWYEEPTLEGRFGASYTEYRLRVSRWIPRPPRGHLESQAR